jgi:putative endonuclease
MPKYYYVYIITNKKNGALYIGVTSDIVKRVWEHKQKFIDGFTKRYNIYKLIYFEQFIESMNAIKREKRLKKYNRQWKIDLIEKRNPQWNDLYEQIISGFPGQAGE